MEAEYNHDQSDDQFMDALRNVVEYHQNTLQLMSLISVMHDLVSMHIHIHSVFLIRSILFSSVPLMLTYHCSLNLFAQPTSTFHFLYVNN